MGEGDILKVMYSDAGILACQGRSRGAPTQPLSTLMRGSLTQSSKGQKVSRLPHEPWSPPASAVGSNVEPNEGGFS